VHGIETEIKREKWTNSNNKIITARKYNIKIETSMKTQEQEHEETVTHIIYKKNQIKSNQKHTMTTSAGTPNILATAPEPQPIATLVYKGIGLPGVEYFFKPML
jgi:predicted RNA-binding protein